MYYYYYYYYYYCYYYYYVLSRRGVFQGNLPLADHTVNSF